MRTLSVVFVLLFPFFALAEDSEQTATKAALKADAPKQSPEQVGQVADFLKRLKPSIPDGWTLHDPKYGKTRPFGWEAGNGNFILVYDEKVPPVCGRRGLYHDVRIWIMDEGYAAVPPSTPGSPAREIAVWRHRRVFLWGRGKRWPTHRADILAILKSDGAEIKGPSVDGELKWGDAIEGVRCRLKADRAVWKSGQVPTFHADVRNDGKKVWALPPSEQLYEIEVDGTWYHWASPGDPAIPRRKPDKRLDNVPIRADGGWFYAKGTPHKPLKFTPGRHTIRVGITPDPEDATKTKRIRVLSNSVAIDVVLFETGPLYIRGDRQHAVQLAPPIEWKDENRTLAEWSKTLGEKDFQLTETDEAWLLLRGAPFRPGADRINIDRIERSGNLITVSGSTATLTSPYKKAAYFVPHFGINLGKLPAGKYEATWRNTAMQYKRGEKPVESVSSKQPPAEGTKINFTITPTR